MENKVIVGLIKYFTEHSKSEVEKYSGDRRT